MKSGDNLTKFWKCQAFAKSLSILNKWWFPVSLPTTEYGRDLTLLCFLNQALKKTCCIITMQSRLVSLQSQVSVFYWSNIHLSSVYSKAFLNPNITVSALDCTVASQIKGCAIVAGWPFFKGGKKEKKKNNPKKQKTQPATLAQGYNTYKFNVCMPNSCDRSGMRVRPARLVRNQPGGISKL